MSSNPTTPGTRGPGKTIALSTIIQQLEQDPASAKLLGPRENRKTKTDYDPVTRMIPIKDMRIDRDYQRLPRPRDIHKIVRDFNEDAVMIPQVSERTENGKKVYYIVEGQQRIISLDRKGYRRVKCEVVNGKAGLSSSQVKQKESDIFNIINTFRSNVSAAVRHKALLLAGDPNAIAIDAAVSLAGMKIHERNGKDKVVAVAKLYKIAAAYGDGEKPNFQIVSNALARYRAVLPANRKVDVKAVGGFAYLLRAAELKDDKALKMMSTKSLEEALEPLWDNELGLIGAAQEHPYEVQGLRGTFSDAAYARCILAKFNKRRRAMDKRTIRSTFLNNPSIVNTKKGTKCYD